MFNSNDFSAAFMQLEALNEADFNLSASSEDEIRDYLDDKDIEDTAVKVVDLDAETENDLDTDNVGKIILQCPCCETVVMKKKDEIELPEDCEEECMVQLGDQCPVCFSEEGFKIIGKVAPYEEVTVEVEPKEEEPVKESLEDEVPNIEELTDEDIEAAKEFLGELNIECEDCAEKVAMAVKTIGEDAVKELIDLGINSVAEEIKEDVEDEDAESEDKEADEVKDDIDESLIECDSVKSDVESEVVESCESESCASEEYLCDDECNGENCKPHIGRPTKVQFEADKKLVKAVNDILSGNESLKEGLNDILLETDSDRISIHSEKKEDGEEMIAPLETSDASEIVDDQAENPEDSDYLNDLESDEEVVEEEPIENNDEEGSEVEEAEITDDDTNDTTDFKDVDVDEIDEKDLDELGESYLKLTYNNVKSYMTESIREDGDKLICEGIITFDSGKLGKTQFILEGNTITSNNHCSMLMENAQITPGKKAMRLEGRIENKKFIPESLNYNYTQNGIDLKGTVKTH